MATSYEAAVAALYRSAPEQFVDERKRLAASLKAEGDKANAARLAKLPRPTLSVWAVNQLWQRERDLFEQLFASAQRLRAGELGATSAHREALAQLRAHAARVLVEAAHPATEATLRRVSATLAALAAAGSFAPDPPGALTADRDPPGFDDAGLSLAGLTTALPAPMPGPPAAQPKQHKAPDAQAARKGAEPGAVQAALRAERAAAEARQRAEREAAEARARAEREAIEAQKRMERELEQRRREEQRLARRAERERLQTALKAAQQAAELAQRSYERLGRELAEAKLDAERTRTQVEQLTALLRSPELD